MYIYFCIYSISELFCAYLQNLVYNHFELKHDYFFDIAEDIYSYRMAGFVVVAFMRNKCIFMQTNLWKYFIVHINGVIYTYKIYCSSYSVKP